MPRKPPPPDPRAVKRDERRLTGLASKPAVKAPAKPAPKGGRK